MPQRLRVHAQVLVVMAMLGVIQAQGGDLADGHIFFYLWYGNPETDGRYMHWNHKVLPHWTESVNAQFPSVGKAFEPPREIHAPFYPQRGCYSSRSTETLEAQFAEIRGTGVGVAVVSWWGRPDQPGAADSQGVGTDDAMHVVLTAAAVAGLRIAFHLEPYPGRSASTIRRDIEYIAEKYGNRSAIFRVGPRNLPLFYVYDSYHITKGEWSRLLTPEGDLSVRGTALDGVFLGLCLNRQDLETLDLFDGLYTYFASSGFSYGSTPRHWTELASWADEREKYFSASVGPGYDDTRIRPWNARNAKPRAGGAYFDAMFSAAVDAAKGRTRPELFFVSITSYNEWGEGTQIEPAKPAEGAAGSYLDYGDGGANFYLEKTAEWINKFRESKRRSRLRSGQAIRDDL